MNIPARILQTARSRNLNPIARASAASVRLLHPDWEYLFFDDEDVAAFMRTERSAHRRAFDRFPLGIQRYDFFRYLAVLRHGGFYFDLDVFLSQSVAELQPTGCVFPFEELTLNPYLRETFNLDWELGNYAFGAAAGDPFVAAIVENCVRAATDAQWTDPMLKRIPAWSRRRYIAPATTGPGLVTRTLAERPDLASGVTVLFPRDVCRPEKWHQFGDFGVHLMQGTWRDREGFLRAQLARLWERRTTAGAIKAGRAQGPERIGPWKRVLATAARTAIA